MRHLFENSDINESADSDWVLGEGTTNLNKLIDIMADTKTPIDVIDDKRGKKAKDVEIQFDGPIEAIAVAQERDDMRFIGREFKKAQVYMLKTNSFWLAFNKEGFAFLSLMRTDVQTEFFPWKIIEGNAKKVADTIDDALFTMFAEESEDSEDFGDEFYGDEEEENQ